VSFVPKADDPTVSVIIVTYQSEALVGSVLDALTADSDGPDEIIVVDNASTDATRQIVDRPGVQLIASPDNLGFAGGVHTGVDAASGDTIVLLGHDTVPHTGWIAPLVDALDAADVGAAMATIEDADKPGTFNTSGGHMTYYGIAWVSDLGADIPAIEPDLVDVAFPSGAAMAIRRDVWQRFGGFRKSLFMYHEDTDLGWRIRLAGLRIVRVPASVVSHEYDFSRTSAKMYWLERNRRALLATNYRAPTRFILAPAFLVADLGVAVVAIRDGWFTQMRKAWQDYHSSRSERNAGRKEVGATRVIGDAEMLETMDSSLSAIRQIDRPAGTGLVDGFFGVYRSAVLPVVAWFDRRAGFPRRGVR
jgi:GT2 family glycosyltransferase